VPRKRPINVEDVPVLNVHIVPLDDAVGVLDSPNLEACLKYEIAIEPLAS
jgi:hypothetical protein